MSMLDLETANAVLAGAFEAAHLKGLKPLAIAVLDAGGHLKAFQKQDGSSMMRFEIAFGKAYATLAMGAGSRFLDQVAAQRPHFVQALTTASHGKIIPVPGGVLIQDAGGTVLGAVGVTGDTSDNDESCAILGIKAAGCQTSDA